ncbi:helix-turn-helix domain-containing protein [Labrys sp. (in: a-proteobacteria)]|uniref:helix-turn-helix domain-containing protein n=1 Tax=unclassified Labrys (in: a-proteobacteria) TaxID=2688601 RepID=UPI0039E6520F
MDSIAGTAQRLWELGGHENGDAGRGTPALLNGGYEISAGHGCVQAVLRAVSILKCIAQDPHGMTLREIVRGTNLAPSTAHRLLTTLQSEGFVQFKPEASRWLVGHGAHLVGVAFLAQ